METVLDTLTAEMPAGAPEWIQLVPAGTFEGEDGRGPYVVTDAAKVISQSLPSGRKLPIDVNHSIDLRQNQGEDTPARGWIVALEARADGIWGKVEWTATGKSLVEDRSYGFISPVFLHSKDPPHRVARIVRASLVNDPNLNLKSLHSRQKGASVLEQLRKELGLAETATEADVLAAVKAAHGAQGAASTVLATIAEAAGVAKDAKADDIVKAINAKGSKPDGNESAEVKVLKDELKSLHTKLDQVQTSAAKERAVTVIDAAIAAGKLVPAQRDRMIARHMKEPTEVEEDIKLMPSLHSGGLKGHKPPEAGDGPLAGDEASVCAMMGLDPKAFAETAKTISRGA